MPPKYSIQKIPLSSSLESAPQHNLRPLTQFFTPRSTSSNKTSSLSPGMIGGLVAFGILALLCAAAAGLALHVHYCRRSDCPPCCAAARLKKRRGHSVHARDSNSFRVQTQRNERTQTHRDRAYLFDPLTQDRLISSPVPFPPLPTLPTIHIRRPQNPEIISNSSAPSSRGSITPSVISEDYAPTLRASEAIHSCPSSRNSPASLVRMVAPFCRTLDGSPSLSADVSIITLPSFVEQECPNKIPSQMLATPTQLAMIEDAFPSSTQLTFQPPRSCCMVANTTTPITPSSEIHLRHDLPSPSMSTPGRLLLLHRTRSPSPRRAAVRRELATAKLKSAVQAEVVKVIQPGNPGTPEQPRAASLPRNALPPLAIPTRTLSFLGDYDYFPYCDCCPQGEEQDTGLVSNDALRPISLKPSPQNGAPPAFRVNDSTEPSSLYQSPVLGFLSSQSSCASLDEKHSLGTSQATSSVSPVPSISAFPPPPDFTPGPRDRVLSILSKYPTYGQPFALAVLRERTSFGGATATSFSEGQTSTPLPASDTPQLMRTAKSRSVLSRHFHSEFTGRDDISTHSGVSSRFLSMKRLSRVPLGPRQMCDRPKLPLWWTSQPPSV